MKTFLHLWQYLAEFSLEWEMFQTKFVEKIKTHILCSVTFSLTSCRLWDNVEKFGEAREAADETLWRMRVACWVNSTTRAHVNAHTHALRHHHTHARAHTEICNTCSFSTATMGTRMRLHITVYVHCLSCVSSPQTVSSSFLSVVVASTPSFGYFQRRSVVLPVPVIYPCFSPLYLAVFLLWDLA